MADFDLILQEVGELGRWHIWVLLLLVPPALLPGMWSVNFVFSGYVPDYRCWVDSCDSCNTSYSSPWLNYTTPREEEDGEEVWSRCHRFRRNTSATDWECAPQHFTTSVEECDTFVFDNTMFKSTVVTEFSLVCDEGKGQVGTLGLASRLSSKNSEHFSSNFI